MTVYRWSELKSIRLKRTRGVSFDEITRCELIKIVEHPTRSGQRIIFFKRRGYIWVVPCVQEGEVVFLKTLYASRKYTQRYQRGEFQ